ncbi:MAG: hypothetical protein F6K42_27235 [Leptolyngbya sp. SIO1D8]|nr:hypothetical protein [Leptolyngbya sp. SIO1D8]
MVFGKNWQFGQACHCSEGHRTDVNRIVPRNGFTKLRDVWQQRGLLSVAARQ